MVQPKNGTEGFLSPLFYFLSFFTPNAHIQSGDALTPSSSLVKFNFDVVVQNFLIMLVVIYFDYKGEVFIVRTEASKYENTWWAEAKVILSMEEEALNILDFLCCYLISPQWLISLKCYRLLKSFSF